MIRNEVKVVVIGLDGATWNLLNSWMENGDLPTLNKLVQNGVSGSLKSSIPFLTIPAWKCYSTGKNPGKLGVYLFYYFDMKEKRIRIHKSTDFKAKEIWDYLTEYGYKSCIINMVGSYPPKRINGFIVSSAIDGVPRNYFYPSTLDETLKKINYILEVDVNFKSPLSGNSLKKIISCFKSRFKLAEILLNEVDFLHLSLFYTDPVQHFHWNEKEKLKLMWTLIDKELGKFIEKIGKNTYLIVMSDHGFCKLKGTLYINNWLLKNGYITIKAKGKTAETFSKIATFFNNILRISGRIASKLGLATKEQIERKHLFSYIDWSKSVAVAIGFGVGLIYLNHETIKSNVNYLKNKLKDQLESIVDPKTGENVVKVFNREEIYSGPYVNKAPDLIVVPKVGYQVVHMINRSEEVWGKCPHGRKAFHDMNGIFLVYGPNIRRNIKIAPITIYDVAPTILHMFNIPVPKDIDGRVINEIFMKQ